MQSDNKSINPSSDRYDIAQSFHNRILVIKFIAQQAPKRTSCADIAEILKGHYRTHQRLLNGLVEYGYIECDNNSPRGYWVDQDKLKGLFDHEND